MHILAETMIEQSEHTVQMVRSRKWADLTLYGALKQHIFPLRFKEFDSELRSLVCELEKKNHTAKE